MPAVFTCPQSAVRTRTKKIRTRSVRIMQNPEKKKRNIGTNLKICIMETSTTESIGTNLYMHNEDFHNNKYRNKLIYTLLTKSSGYLTLLPNFLDK